MDFLVVIVSAPRQTVLEMVCPQEKTAISPIQRDIDFAQDNCKAKEKKGLKKKLFFKIKIKIFLHLKLFNT